MKKSLLALLLLAILLTVSTASAKKYTPDDKIGLFIDPELFQQCLYKTNLGSQITSYKTGQIGYAEVPTNRIYEQYDIKNSILLIDYLDLSMSKITSISLFFSRTFYRLRDDEVYDVLETVLKCTGLLYNESAEVMKTVRKTYYLNDSYYVFVFDDDRDYITVWIDDYYTQTREDPYSKMSKYNRSCDTNYVGACVPITSKDLECRDIGVRNFFVVGTDKHNFDADRNGVCCEPYSGN